MSSIVIESENIQSLEQETNQFLDDHMEELYNTWVIPEVKRMAEAMLLPSEFVDSIRFEKTGQNQGKVINDFGVPDLPLAVWFNYGTKRFYPITPKVQHPEGASPRATRDTEDVGEGHIQHPSVLHWVDESGKDHFRKKVIHPGFPKTLAMEFGVNEGKKKLMTVLPNIIAESDLVI